MIKVNTARIKSAQIHELRQEKYQLQRENIKLREEIKRLKEKLERIEMSKVEILDDDGDELTENYRLDSKEKEDGEWWLEELDDDGLPTENYISVDDEQLKQLKDNGQIWKYSDDLDCWVKPEGE